MPRLSASALLAALLLLLVGCPEERPGAEKQIPPQRVPPAVSLDPAPTDGGPAPGWPARAPAAERSDAGAIQR
ncbi:MAG TPA: hypothetical protein VEM76_02910 [Anaeromyxobacteraceae bacterium]|nr:hypothetical protein [Anaeromyxobacteraceae bacterium]